MNRDLDYVREILLELEAEGDHAQKIMLLDTSAKERNHILIMTDAGLLIKQSKYGYRISWQGYEYLDAVRDEGIWNQTKNAVAETGGSVSLEIAKALATGFLKKKLSQHTGIEL